MSFVEDCRTLDAALRGPVRRGIVDAVSGARTFDRSLVWLRDGLRAHRFQTSAGDLVLDKLVRRWENRARQQGFHLLHDWDGELDAFREDTIPVEVANLARTLKVPGTPEARRNALAVLLDFELLYDLALLAMAALDQPDADVALRDVGGLLAALQGPQGSGHAFVRDPSTLILIATAHFEPDVTAYDRLRAKAARLDFDHRLEMALVHAPILGCHLGFGLDVTCAGNVAALRDDNVPDYPWLCMALATLFEALDQSLPSTTGSTTTSTSTSPTTLPSASTLLTTATVLDAILSGLSPDPRAFATTDSVDALEDMMTERAFIRERLVAHRARLREEFDKRAPRDDAYSPLRFSFNFPHNLVKGLVVDALLRGTPGRSSLNALLTPAERHEGASTEAAARTLMGFAIACPDTIRGHPHPAIVYDAAFGTRAFERARGALG